VYTDADTTRGLIVATTRHSPPIFLGPDQGTTYARVTVETDGTLTVDTLYSSGRHDRTEQQTAKEGLAQWFWNPATLNGCAVRYRMLITISTGPPIPLR
jgi:hypothetical protein